MKSVFKLIIFAFAIVSVLNGSDEVYSKIEKMNKGIDGYIVGKTLSDNQSQLLVKNSIKSNDINVAKFLASDNLIVVVNKSNNKIVAINKRFKNVEQKELQKLLGEFIFKYDEPTVMAHDKMIYWVYDKNNKKLSEDDLKKWKASLVGKKTSNSTLVDAVKKDDKKVDFDPYVSIKMSSSEAIMTQVKDPKPSQVSILISSNILIQNTTK